MSTDPTGPKRSRKRRRRKAKLSVEERAVRVIEELERLVRAAGVNEGLDADELFPLSELILPISLRFDGDDRKTQRREAAERLATTVRADLRQGIEGSTSFCRGRVYCFLCNGNDCRHSSPSDPADTFSGYTPTGKPTWIGFTNLCLERGERRVDRLYADPPEVIAILQTSNELTGNLLPRFGRDNQAFNVLGQVVAGLLPASLSLSKSTADRVAFTIQLVETRAGDARRRVRMNQIGLDPDVVAAASSNSNRRVPAERLHRALREARRETDALGRRLTQSERAGRVFDPTEPAIPILTSLRSEIERAFRPSNVRTRHAQRRHVDGRRPTDTALRDARSASEEKILRDVRRDTFVILGPRGRAHLFSPEGRHVTSLQLKPGEVERKSGQGRWRAVGRVEIDAFREQLARATPLPRR